MCEKHIGDLRMIVQKGYSLLLLVLTVTVGLRLFRSLTQMKLEVVCSDLGPMQAEEKA